MANGIKDLNAQKGDVDSVPGVVGAIIFDVGGRRFSRVTPDDRLGRAALDAAEPGWFPLGARGAGRFAMQGVYYARGTSADRSAGWAHSGQGAAFRTFGPTKVAVFTVVNALGTIVDRTGRVVRCSRNAPGGECPLIADRLKAFTPIGGSDAAAGGPTGNTTLTLVVTNQKLPLRAPAPRDSGARVDEPRDPAVRDRERRRRVVRGDDGRGRCTCTTPVHRLTPTTSWKQLAIGVEPPAGD